MRILQLCSKIPFPPKDGGSIAMNILTEGLIKAGSEVKVMAIATPKNTVNIDDLPANYREMTNPEIIFIDTSIKPEKALLNLFQKGSYNIERFYSPKFEEKLIKVLKSEIFDIIQLETLWVSPYIEVIRKYSKAKVVLRSQNVEFRIWERLAAITKNPFKKKYLEFLASRLKKYELGLLNKYDAIAAITPEDQKDFIALGCKKPIIHVPFGINSSDYKPDVFPSEVSLFHIGAMDWKPNQEAIKWFLKEVWPFVHETHKDLKIYLAGRNMPAWINQINLPNVIVAGEVPDAIRFMQRGTIMIVPLFSGGGMRIKIIEGMALGKTVISTRIGAEGISYENNKNILIANNAAEFIRTIDMCIKNEAFCQSIGEEASKMVEEHYDNSRICRELTVFYKDLIGK